MRRLWLLLTWDLVGRWRRADAERVARARLAHTEAPSRAVLDTERRLRARWAAAERRRIRRVA